MQKMPPAIFTGTVFGLLQSFGLGSHRVWKTWKTWKNNIFWKNHGKSWNFEKSSKVMEKSWNLENLTPINHPPALEIWHW